jgi:hypothetical protein
MASFARKWLEGILENEDLSTKEKAQQIMDGHIAVTDGLKDERDSYKQEAEKAADLQKQLDEKNGGEDFKQKYEKEHQDFEDFKKRTASEAEAAKVRSAYRKLLSGEGISEKRLDSILKVTDLSKMKLDKDGNLEKADELKKAINDEWGEFKTTVTERGAKVETPLQTGKATKTKEEIFAIKDTAARQKAIAENHELFGF